MLRASTKPAIPLKRMAFLRGRNGRIITANGRRSMASSIQTSPPTLEGENAAFEARVASLNSFVSQKRFDGINRPYTAADIATKQGSLPVHPPVSAVLADKLFALLTKAETEKLPLHTMGAIDPVQMTQMAKHQEVLYVSGWACSSVLTTANNEVGPDLAYAKLFYEIIFVLMCGFRAPLETVIIHIPPCLIRCIGCSVHSSYTIGSTMMSGCQSLLRLEQRWNTLITCVPSLLMLIPDMAVLRQS